MIIEASQLDSFNSIRVARGFPVIETITITTKISHLTPLDGIKWVWVGVCTHDALTTL